MTFILLFGPPASGKMTVGRELARATGYKLLHNHMTLELVNHFFDFMTPPFIRLDTKIRMAIFEEVAQSELPGLIFTLVWALDLKEDHTYVRRITDLFVAKGARICFVELQAALEVRKERNRHPDRLEAKPSKRDLAFSEKNLLEFERDFRMNTLEGEILPYPHLCIDNSKLSPEAVARRIRDHFGL